MIWAICEYIGKKLLYRFTGKCKESNFYAIIVKLITNSVVNDHSVITNIFLSQFGYFSAQIIPVITNKNGRYRAVRYYRVFFLTKMLKVHKNRNIIKRILTLFNRIFLLSLSVIVSLHYRFSFTIYDLRKRNRKMDVTTWRQVLNYCLTFFASFDRDVAISHSFFLQYQEPIL